MKRPVISNNSGLIPIELSKNPTKWITVGLTDITGKKTIQSYTCTSVEDIYRYVFEQYHTNANTYTIKNIEENVVYLETGDSTGVLLTFIGLKDLEGRV